MSNHETNGMPQARVQVAHPYLALMGYFLGAFTGMYSETALNIALPQLSATFGVELAFTQWLVIGYMLVIGVVLPFSSLLSKWFPARKITMFALVIFLAGTLVSAAAPNFGIALAGRALQGVGTGLVLPLMFAMVLEVVPPHKIGAAMGMAALVIMSASAVGPTLAGVLVGMLSWRAVFISFAVALVIAMAFTLKFSVNPYELTKPHIDAMSVVTSCLGFGGIVLGAGLASLTGWASVPTIGSLAVGIMSLAVYAKRQMGMESPVIDLNIFKNSGFRTGAICVMLNFGITLSVMFVLPQFYQNAMLLAVSLAGIVMLPGGIVNAIVSVVAGNIFDRIGARIPAILGFSLSIASIAMFMFAAPESPLAYVVACHILLMIGVPLAMSPSQTYALASLPHRLSTDGSTMLNTMQQVLGAVCTAMATFLLAFGQDAYYAGGATDSAAAFSQGSHYGFIFALALAVIALLFALRIKKRPATAIAADAAASIDADVAAKPASAAVASTGVTADPAHREKTLLAQLAKRDVFTLSEDDTALAALKMFSEKEISGAPVVDSRENLTGFVSDGDIMSTMSRISPSFSGLYSFAVGDDDSFEDRIAALESTTVGQLATRNVLTVGIDDDMRDVCTLLVNHHLKKAPVMDGDRMVGIINRSNIIHSIVCA